MSVRSLGSLLTRRFPPRGIPRARAQAQAKTLGPAVGVPARSVHSLRDLAVGDGAYGSVAAAAFTGLVGILYFLKGGDKSADEVIREEAGKGGDWGGGQEAVDWGGGPEAGRHDGSCRQGGQ